MSHIHRLTTVTGSVLAAAALAAGPAAAQSGVPRGADLRSPDARDAAAGRTTTTPRADLRSPDARDAATRAPVVVRVVPAAPSDSGLSWDSAAIGALAGAGLLISMAGGGLLVVRRRPRPA